MIARLLLVGAFAWLVSPAGAARAQTSDGAIGQIQAAIERGDLDTAKRIVDAALTASPGNPVLHNFAGAIVAQQGDVTSAETHFREAIRLAPRAVPPHENLGRLYQEHTPGNPGFAAKALEVYRALLAIEPAHTDALFQSALLEAIAGRFKAANRLLDRLPADLVQRPQVLAVRMAVLSGLLDATGARMAAESLGAHPDLVVADVIAVLPAFEHVRDDTALGVALAALDRRGLASVDLQRRLAAIDMRHDRYGEAREVLERAAAHGPTAPILVDLARAADLAGDHKGALGYLAHARTLEPDNATVHFLFGIVCVELDLGREAYESLQKAVALDPDNPAVNYVMGAIALTRRDPTESLPFLEKYVRLKPDDPRGRLALGSARFFSQQFEGARSDLEAAARHPETAMGAHYFLGRLARQSNDLATARRELEQAIALNATYPDSWAELGLVLMRQGEHAAAADALAKALAIDPDHYTATVNLAALYGRTKDPRREATAARIQVLQQKREQRAQDFLRLIEVVPPASASPQAAPPAAQPPARPPAR